MQTKMLIKSVTLLCLCALTQPASVRQRNIPVEIKYDDGTTDSIENSKIELTGTEGSEIIRTSSEVQENAVKNLNEKIQLAPEDLTQALKHLPQVEDLTLKDLRGVQPEQLAIETNIQSTIQQVEDIIYGGLKNLRNSFKGEKDQKIPSSQQWDDLEKAVNDYLSEQKIQLQLKQDQPSQNQNIFQNIAQGFQTIANNFVQNLSGNQNSNTNSTNQGDEQQGGQAQGPFQGFINFFQNGVNNVVNSINGLGGQGSTTSNTVLGDTGTATTQAPGFVSNFVNNVQQFFGQIQGAAQGGSSSGTQGDSGNGTSSSSPQGPGQIIQSIGSAINQFIQGRPPSTSGDEGTGTTQASVNIIQSIGNVIQNSPFNPFRPPQGAASTSSPIQAGISGAQNIGNQIQQLIPGQGTTTDATKIQDQVVNNQSPQTANETIKDTEQEQTKEIVSDEVTNDPIQEAAQQTESPEISSEETVSQAVQEEIKGEKVERQMEEQVKIEEVKEELKREKIKDVEEKEVKQQIEYENKESEGKKEILATVE